MFSNNDDRLTFKGVYRDLSKQKALLGVIERFTFFAGSPQNNVTESLAVEQATFTS